MSNTANSKPLATAGSVAEKLRRLPESATLDFHLFRTKGDEAALTRLIIAALTDLAPDKARRVIAWTDDTRLVEDVGFDSLSIAETIFFFEDLFQISISNQEILQVRSFGELRSFVKEKAKAVASSEEAH